MNEGSNMPVVSLAFDTFTLKKQYPCIYMSNEENVALIFMDAVTRLPAEEAKKYVSKNFVDMIDLNELRDFFQTNTNFKMIRKMNFNNVPKNCCVNSMIFMDGDKKDGSIVNLHLIKEPDKYSTWKIYNVDQEMGL